MSPRPKTITFITPLLAITAGLLSAQTEPTPWRSSLYPENWTPPHTLPDAQKPHFLTDTFLQDFSFAGYRQGQRPLPQPHSLILDVVDSYDADPTGETDSTAAIQAALDFATSKGGGIVYLPPGEYQLSVPVGADSCLQINSSGTILRGAGPTRTRLFNTTTEMRNAEIIRVRPNDWGSWTTETSTPILLAADALGPTTELTLASLDSLSVGDWIVVHNPPSVAFITELNMDEGPDDLSWIPDQEYLGGPRILRQITAVDEETNSITIDVPTRWQLTTRDGARVYQTASHLYEVGLEDFSIGNLSIPGAGWEEADWDDPDKAAYHAHDSFAIELRGVVNGWIRNVHSYNPGNANEVHVLSNGIKLEWSRNVTLSQLNFQHAQYGGAGGNGYMIRFNSANECLITHSETGNCRHGIVMWMMENSGNVVTQSYDHDNGIQFSDTDPVPTAGSGSDHHGVFSHSNLFDSNRLERSYLEAAYRGDWGGLPDHGITSSQCVFWNTQGIAYNSRADYIVHSQQFGQGYVIGTRGDAPNVRLTEKRPDSAVRTDPVDFAEGIGLGDSLTPSSLYRDQLTRRLNPEQLARLQTSGQNPDSLHLSWQTSANLPWQLESSTDLKQWENQDALSQPQGSLDSDLPENAVFFRVTSPEPQ